MLLFSFLHANIGLLECEIHHMFPLPLPLSPLPLSPLPLSPLPLSQCQAKPKHETDACGTAKDG